MAYSLPGVGVTIELSVLRHLALEVAPRALSICRRCRRDAAPRRLWSCRGLTVVHRFICFDCVGRVARKWSAWIDWILEPRPIGVFGGME